MKNLLKNMLLKDVHPALGCTEPIAIAYAASRAMDIQKKVTGKKNLSIKELIISVDPGVFKNGMGVTIPNSFGQKGNRVAAVLGALCGKSAYSLQVLKDTREEDVAKARKLLEKGTVKLVCKSLKDALFINVFLKTNHGESEVTIERFHTNITRIRCNGENIDFAREEIKVDNPKTAIDYSETLKNCTIADLVACADAADEADLHFIREGIEMNMEVAREGRKLGLLGATFIELEKKGIFNSDILTDAEIVTACATDARMNGSSLPVMSSGGSGNQGIVAILVPYVFGKGRDIPEDKVLKSIALSHLLNAQMKCFTGELSPMCGCAIAAGIGATAAVVYQLTEGDVDAMGRAINCLTGDITGMLCDGAKGGCSLKVASSARSAIKSALIACEGLNLSGNEGIVGKTPEETLRNIGLMSTKGMMLVNDTCVSLMLEQ